MLDFLDPIGLYFWWGLAIIAASSQAAEVLVNQQFKPHPSDLALWRGWGVALVLLPFILITPYPENFWFYPLMVANGLLVSYCDWKVFKLITDNGAGVVTRCLPLTVLISFVMWWAIEPQQLLDLTTRPLYFIGVGAALGLCMAGVMLAKRNPLNLQVLIALAPAMFLYAVVEQTNKIAMNLAPITSALLYYLFIQALVIGIVTISQYQRLTQRKLSFKSMLSKRSLLIGGLFLTTFLVAMAARNTSLKYAPNPAYASGIGLLAPFIVIGFNKVLKVKDDSQILSGVLVIAGVILLILLTA